MKLTLLGTGTCNIDVNHHESGYLLEVAGKKILLDSGSGTVYRILEAGSRLGDIECIMYTHHHPDHISDLPAILQSSVWGEHRLRTLCVYGPEGTCEYVDRVSRDVGELSFPVCVHEIGEGEFGIGDVRVRSVKLDHSVNHGYRIEHGGKIISYTGDTNYCDAIFGLIENSDIAIMECGGIENHLSPENCGEILKDSGVKIAILVHRYPALDGVDVESIVGRYFDGKVVIGEDLMNFNI